MQDPTDATDPSGPFDPSAPLAGPRLRLLDALREQVRCLHYSPGTEEACLHWVRVFIRFHDRRHLARLGRPEVEAFLCWLGAERQVSASTHQQALPQALPCRTRGWRFLRRLTRRLARRRISPLTPRRAGPPPFAAPESTPLVTTSPC